MIGDLVEDELRPRATGLLQITMGLAIVFGPLLAIPLYFGLGAQSAFLIDALSFVISFLAIFRLARAVSGTGTRKKPRPVLAEFAIGIRFFTRNRVLTTLFIAIFLSNARSRGDLGPGYILCTTKSAHAGHVLWPVKYCSGHRSLAGSTQRSFSVAARGTRSYVLLIDHLAGIARAGLCTVDKLFLSAGRDRLSGDTDGSL